MAEAQDDWLALLSQEVQRKDARHRFLLGILVTSIGALWLLITQHSWDLPLYSFALGLTLAAVAFLVCFAKALRKIYFSLQSTQTPHFDYWHLLVLTRLVVRMGIPVKTRIFWGISGVSMVGVVLFFLWEALTAPSVVVELSALWLLLYVANQATALVSLLVLPRGFWLRMLRQALRVFGREMTTDYPEQRQYIDSLNSELLQNQERGPKPWDWGWEKGFELAFRHRQKSASRVRIGTLLVFRWAIRASVLAAFVNVILQPRYGFLYNFWSYVHLAAIGVLVLFALQLFLIVLFEGERTYLEQLRQAVIRNEIDGSRIPAFFDLVDLIQSNAFFPREQLLKVAQIVELPPASVRKDL